MAFTTSYSQNREDYLISCFFPDVKKGFYVDVGANDPDEDSVTKLFYKEGWHGINIEPLRSKYLLLQQKRPRDINLNIGISSRSGKMSFREYSGHGLSTFSSQMKSEYKEKNDKNIQTYKDYEVTVKTLKEVFEENKVKTINFIKIDVEGLEAEVIRGNEWGVFRPELICIEANHVHKEWKKSIINKKYTPVLWDGLNEYYLAEESMHRREMFSQQYPDKMLSGPQVIKWTVADEFGLIISQREEEIKKRDKLIENLDKLNKSLHHSNEKLTIEIKDQKKLVIAAKNTIIAFKGYIARSIGKKSNDDSA